MERPWIIEATLKQQGSDQIELGIFQITTEDKARALYEKVANIIQKSR